MKQIVTLRTPVYSVSALDITMAHLEHQGTPVSLILDVVEVAKSHSGANLASAFTQILQNFSIEHKVSTKKNSPRIC